MIKLTLRLLFLSLAFSGAIFAADVPFKFEKGYLLIEGKVEKTPIEAAIFTGSPYSYFSGDLIEKSKLRLSYTNDGPVQGNSSDKVLFFAQVPNIVVGDEKPVSLNMRQRPFEQMNQSLGRKIDVILGADFFKGKTLQIDFSKKVLRFLDNPPNAVNSFAMDSAFVTFDGKSITLPEVDEISIGGSSVRCLVDTSSPYPITISPAAASKFSLAPVPDKKNTARAKIASVKLGGYELNDVPALVFGKEAGFDKKLSEHGAVIGLGVLQNFLVTFDWKGKKIYFEQ